MILILYQTMLFILFIAIGRIGMWVGSYFGGVNYYPYQWTYFEKFYPREEIKFFWPSGA